jgi:SAM-dependent methyltransferase
MLSSPVKNKYDSLAKFYDEVIGHYEDNQKIISDVIAKYNSKTEKILELGCGTGGNLETFAKKFSVYGIDNSDNMLEISKQKIPEGKFFNMDISDFQLNEKFDLIFCVYDTINHLLSLDKWTSLFRSSYEHLNENGILLFDINTLFKLKTFSKNDPFVHDFGNNIMIVKVTEDEEFFNWDIRIFEYKTENEYILHREVLKEISFSESTIKKELNKYFKLLKISGNENRLYFICRKK